MQSKRWKESVSTDQKVNQKKHYGPYLYQDVKRMAYNQKNQILQVAVKKWTWWNHYNSVGAVTSKDRFTYSPEYISSRVLWYISAIISQWKQ